MYKKFITITNDDDVGTTYSHEDISTYGKDDISDDWLLADYKYIQKLLRRVSGKVLTIIDASIQDRQQNKAVKDLIRNEISDLFVDTSTALCPLKGEEIAEIQEDSIPVGVTSEELLKE